MLDLETLPAAMAGVDAAYYLIHSMRDGTDFHYRDLLAAHRFGIAAREAGLQRIIYLGGWATRMPRFHPTCALANRPGRCYEIRGYKSRNFGRRLLWVREAFHLR